jgi:DNA-binding transcriptional ArsR family regulator
MVREPWMRIFDAFGDPTRRMIFERLWRRPMAVGELAEGLPVTRSAVSQHLKVFKDLGLVAVRTQGSRRVYAVEPAGLWPLRSWIEGHMPVALAGRSQPVQRPLQDVGGGRLVHEIDAAGAGQVGL